MLGWPGSIAKIPSGNRPQMTLSVAYPIERANPLRGLLPLWIGIGVYTLLLLAGNRLLLDPDTMWQVTVGQWILEHRAVPETDVYSFTMRGQPWISTQWLAQVIYAEAYAVAGWSGPVVVAAGFLLALRIPSGRSYWTAVLPALLVLSLGMAGAVAPLTTAVLASVDAVHSGVASGLNSALARTGGLVATAFASAVLAVHGAQLSGAFRTAMVVGAAAALAAGFCAYLYLEKKETT